MTALTKAPEPATAPAAARPDWIDAYDGLTLEIEQAGALTGLIADRLSAIDEEADLLVTDGRELFALSLIARSVSAKLELMLHHARDLQGALTIDEPVTAEGIGNLLTGGAK